MNRKQKTGAIKASNFFKKTFYKIDRDAWFHVEGFKLEIGDAIYKKMLTGKFTDKGVAKKAGIPLRRFKNFMTGRTTPTLLEIAKIFVALGVAPVMMLSWREFRTLKD